MFEGVNRQEWHDRATCNYHDADLWWYEYPDQHDEARKREVAYQVKTAIKICNECPVKRECLVEGLKSENMHEGSIWGGLIFTQRRQLARRGRSGYNEKWLLEALKKQRAKVREASK